MLCTTIERKKTFLNIYFQMDSTIHIVRKIVYYFTRVLKSCFTSI